MDLPETVEAEPSGECNGSVIWLHGLGADGHDFEPIVPDLELDGRAHLRFVFPHAPVRPVTINGGMAMRAWYDIYTLDRDGPVDEAGIRQSSVMLEGLIQRECDRGIPGERIVVAGFSQGGAIASHSALRHADPLGGLMVLSSYLPLHSSMGAEVFDNPKAQRKDLPIFMAHGSMDPMVPMALGQASRAIITEHGYSVEWRDYPMGHAVCAEEIEDIRHWLLSVFT
jgi:phospholipase/carboxylesterase